jgi:nitroreductase
MKAPTGSNAQNWEFIVVKDREIVAKLGRDRAHRNSPGVLVEIPHL